MTSEVRVARPETYARGARVVYQPRSTGDEKPWVVDSRWYDIHNGERYSDNEVCTSQEYAAAARRKRKK